MAPHVLVLHGPNLNLLGTREPGVYGATTLAEIDRALDEQARARGATVECHQTNIEGELVDRIQSARGRAHAIIINPAAYTHTSVAIADALRAVALPAVEVHLSNVHAREPFRQQSFVAPVCVGTIGGFGARGYTLALDAVLDLLEQKAKP
ncbi:MAG TPA: type II 3-dehydroquinate dehydratase [Polyangia bacterium]|jgi:3-dehydroquinate dehydratase-2|nr:type II 3-dehydroquinate dehydratase [Polyangia bacterium]